MSKMEPLESLAARILESMTSTDVVVEATYHLGRCRSLGLVSDWEGCGKVDDFARLIGAAERVLPGGGSIETGVFRGGSAGPLILSDAANSFHVSVDPFGLPTQSYGLPQYGDWPAVRRTLSTLAALAEERGVTFCHYMMDSLSFVRGDYLRHPAPFRIVHLDGDHGEETVASELTYFRQHIAGPALFVLDDHDEHYPGVEEAVRKAGAGMARVLHRYYDFPNYGVAGFSAWLHARA